MTRQDILDALRQIKACSKTDDENAHRNEDELYVGFVKHLATHAVDLGGSEVSNLARLVLKTRKIEFHRWCA
jgi:hypothetical protein